MHLSELGQMALDYKSDIFFVVGDDRAGLGVLKQ